MELGSKVLLKAPPVAREILDHATMPRKLAGVPAAATMTS
jgi:hypothetical protein